MRLTTKSEYALLALVYIARQARGKGPKFVKIEDICAKYGFSKKYLEQIFATLKNAHYIKARRGANGGYGLAKPAEKIVVAEIIRLMDGALASNLAVSKYFYSKTPLEKEKRIIKVFKEIRDYISFKLETLTILDLI